MKDPVTAFMEGFVAHGPYPPDTPSSPQPPEPPLQDIRPENGEWVSQ